LIRSEKVTFSFGVPTVFLGLFAYLDAQGIKHLDTLQRVVIGGAAPPRAMIQRLMFDLKVQVIQGSASVTERSLHTSAARRSGYC